MRRNTKALRLKDRSFIKSLAKQTDLKSYQVLSVLNKLYEAICKSLKRDNEVKWEGLGKFIIQYRASQLGVNPRDPIESVVIPAYRTPRFVASRTFKKQIQK